MDAPYGCSISFIRPYIKMTRRLALFFGDLFLKPASYESMKKVKLKGYLFSMEGT